MPGEGRRQNGPLEMTRAACEGLLRHAGRARGDPFRSRLRAWCGRGCAEPMALRSVWAGAVAGGHRRSSCGSGCKTSHPTGDRRCPTRHGASRRGGEGRRRPHAQRRGRYPHRRRADARDRRGVGHGAPPHPPGSLRPTSLADIVRLPAMVARSFPSPTEDRHVDVPGQDPQDHAPRRRHRRLPGPLPRRSPKTEL